MPDTPLQARFLPRMANELAWLVLASAGRALPCHLLEFYDFRSYGFIAMFSLRQVALLSIKALYCRQFRGYFLQSSTSSPMIFSRVYAWRWFCLVLCVFAWYGRLG